MSAYWNERRGGLVRPAIPGHAMASSLLALGYAVGGRHEDAEQMAARAMNQGKSVCGALATWAQCHVFDARGGVAEGISGKYCVCDVPTIFDLYLTTILFLALPYQPWRISMGLQTTKERVYYSLTAALVDMVLGSL